MRQENEERSFGGPRGNMYWRKEERYQGKREKRETRCTQARRQNTECTQVGNTKFYGKKENGLDGSL